MANAYFTLYRFRPGRESQAKSFGKEPGNLWRLSKISLVDLSTDKM